MTEIKNHYFKDNGDHYAYMSGLPLPDESVNTHFINCDFHPCCFNDKLKFTGCVFTNCEMPWKDQGQFKDCVFE